MIYTVHEIFLTLQGEGANMGMATVFVRFAGCNLWSGREEDRASAVCQFCDTRFRGGVKHTARSLADAMASLWPAAGRQRRAVLTGGEPLLQVDEALVFALRDQGWWLAVETNGTQPIPRGLNWVCVSPKGGAPLAAARADELKLVFPQAGAEPERFEEFDARHRWLSPMDGPQQAANMAEAAAYCISHPQWRLNIQAHKVWGVA